MDPERGPKERARARERYQEMRQDPERYAEHRERARKSRRRQYAKKKRQKDD
jgi:hypothetical protein